MAAPAPWRKRLDGLGLTIEEKGRAIPLIMRMPEADREMLVDTDPAVAKVSVREVLSAAAVAPTAEVVSQSEFRQLKRMVEMNAVEMAQKMAKLEHTVTTHSELGSKVLQAASIQPRSPATFPCINHPLPNDVINDIFKSKWARADTENDLEALAFPAVMALLRSVRQGDAHELHALDTHMKAFYTGPTAKIDIAISDAPAARWLSLVAPIELKLDLKSESDWHTVIGQLMQRFTQVRQGGQSDRTHMYGLAWGKADVAVWRFSGPGTTSYATTGKVEFVWDNNNAGYQLLCGFLSLPLLSYGYRPVAVPATCQLTTPCGGIVELSDFKPLAGSAQIRRLVFTAKAKGSVVGGTMDAVVVKVGLSDQISDEWRRLYNRQAEVVLPRAIACGTLDPPVQGLVDCYVSSPLGKHFEDGDDPQEVLAAMAELANALGRLRQGVSDRGGLLHRDVSPHNIVVHRDPTTGLSQVYLLDLHVAKSLSEGCGGEATMAGVDDTDNGVTGKVAFMSLRLSQPHPQHSLATDLESLFYSLLDIASCGRALRWRHGLKTQAPKLKFATMYYPPEWHLALEQCREEFRPALHSLHRLIFKSSFSEYLSSEVTPQEFAAAVVSGAGTEASSRS